MKRIILTAVILLGQFLSLCTPLLSNDTEREVIVEFMQGDDCSEAVYNYIDMIEARMPTLKVEYVYDTVLCGFSAKLTEAEIISLSKYSFVKNIYNTAEYEALEYSKSDFGSSLDMIGVEAARKENLSGEGVKIAIIDNGFDVTHPVFAGEVKETLDLTAFEFKGGHIPLTALLYSLDIHKFYVNSKIPFAYDYADKDTDILSPSSSHGTHVAGIIGAKETDDNKMNGVAPDCQLILMKVFSDAESKAKDSVLIAAIEDAIKLGADIINLSLGYYSGSTDKDSIVGFDAILEKAKSHGTIIVTAAGNQSTSTVKGRIATNSGILLPPADYTDYGTMSFPASTDSTIAVASAENKYKFGKHFLLTSDNKKAFYYSDTNKDRNVIDCYFEEYFDNKILEYVPIDNLGEAADYEGIDVKGKIALVKRGTISFLEKVNVAADMGAVAVIVYNNVENEYFNMELEGAKIPAISIKLEDGEELIKAKEKKLIFSKSFVFIEKPGLVGKISDFSAYGATPSLTLKPDITAIGGDVLSSVNGGKYEGYSGTSMASPQFAGVCALLLERAMLENPLMTKEDRAKLSEEISIKLMNSAIPIQADNGVEYSPRGQGAGLVNADAALASEIKLTYSTNGKAKAELFDGYSDTMSFDITVENQSDRQISAELGVSLTSDGYTELEYNGKMHYFNSLQPIADSQSVIAADDTLNINKYSDNYAPYIISLDPGQKKTLTINFKFSKEYYEALDEIFTNGLFLEGFVFVDIGEYTVSMPYMAYRGSWASAPVLDGCSFDGELVIFKDRGMIIEVDKNFLNTGVNPFSSYAGYEEQVYSGDRIYFSPNNDGYADILHFCAPNVRNTRSAVLSVTDENGEVIYMQNRGYMTKLSDRKDNIHLVLFWEGGDGLYSRYRFPDGDYKITVEYTLDYKEGYTDTYSFDVTIDTSKPTVSDIKYENGKLCIEAYDDNKVQSVCLYEGGVSVGDKNQNGFLLVELDSKAEFDIEAFTGDTLYVEVVDYAFNTYVERINLSDIKGTAA